MADGQRVGQVVRTCPIHVSDLYFPLLLLFLAPGPQLPALVLQPWIFFYSALNSWEKSCQTMDK